MVEGSKLHSLFNQIIKEVRYESNKVLFEQKYFDMLERTHMEVLRNSFERGLPWTFGGF